VSVTKDLLAAGAHVDHIVDDDCDVASLVVRSRSTALCIASEADPIDIAELLCEAGAAIDPVDGDGRLLACGPLAIAAEAGSFAMVRFLVGKGAKLNVGLHEEKAFGPYDPLACALKHRQYDIATFLLEAGATFNATSWRGRPPLARVCELIETEPDKAKPLAPATLMVQRGLDTNAGVHLSEARHHRGHATGRVGQSEHRRLARAHLRRDLQRRRGAPDPPQLDIGQRVVQRRHPARRTEVQVCQRRLGCS
jgi:ankyrin repeat protein